MEDSGNLLTYNTGKDLQIINIVNTVKSENNENNVESWKAKYPEVFSGKIGKLENFKLKLHIDKTVKPVQAAQRNHPFHLRKDIDKHLDSLLEQDIIEEVKGIPTTWLSETVNVKKEGSKDIRMCIDMKAANTAIQSEKYEMPNIENLIYKATGMKRTVKET